jgi:ABC-type transport system involved in multi-copper enzyme maturation permease subunit
MTASISKSRPRPGVAAAGAGALPGLAALARKELMEWRRARRTWVVLTASGLFLILGSLNSWLVRLVPADAADGKPLPSLDPLSNLVGPVSTHVFVVIAIFAVMALISVERETGTLAWTAVKPVSRSAIWLAKLGAATGVLWLTAGIVPLAASLGVVAILYGVVPPMAIVSVAVGMGMVIALFVAISLAASTVVTSQAAVAGITLTVISIAPMLGQVLPDPTLMPTAILGWSIKLGVGQPVSPLSPIGWTLAMSALVAFSLRRMERLEL